MKSILRSLLWAIPITTIASWPLAQFWNGLVQRNADAYGSAWLIWRLGGDLQALATDLRFVDTLLFALLSPLAGNMGPSVGYHLLTLLALILSFVVGERVSARCFNTPWPSSIIAGMAFSINPLVGTALVEGHGGMLIGAGLALILGALELEPGERKWRWSMWVVLAGILCALQSGYFGLMAALVVVVYGGIRRRPLLRVFILAVVPAAAYAHLVLGWDAFSLETIAMRVGDRVAPAASADTLAGVPPGMDLSWYHSRYPLLFSLLAFGGLLPLLRNQGPDRALVITGAIAVALALGAEARLTAFSQSFPDHDIGGPWGWLTWALEPLALFRFPTRFMWVWYLCSGIAAARVCGWLFAQKSRSFAAVFVVAADLLYFGMRPSETRTTIAEVPSAYEILAPSDVVLDLWPWYSTSLSLPFLNLSCYYQTGHSAQLPYTCLTVASRTSPLRGQVEGVISFVLADEPEQAKRALNGGSVSHVAWHPDAFTPEGRRRVGEVLERWWGAPLASSRDGGEDVVIWRVREGQRAAGTTVQAWSSSSSNTCDPSSMCAEPVVPPESPHKDPLPPWSLPLLAIGLLGPLTVLARKKEEDQ